MLARAMAQEAPELLLDEPTSALALGRRPDDGDAPGGGELGGDGADAAARAEDQQRLAGLEVEMLQHAERGLADRDDGGRGLEGHPRGLGHRVVQKRVLGVPAGRGDAEDLVADRRARAFTGRVHDAGHVEARQNREPDGEDAVHQPAADLRVDRVDGDRADADPDLAGRRLRQVGLRQGQDLGAAVTVVGNRCGHRMLRICADRMLLGVGTSRPE